MSALARAFAPEVLAEIEQLIDERAEAIAHRLFAECVESSGQEWLSTEQAADRLGISRDGVRMRVNRGTLVGRRRGRRLEVSMASVRGG